MEGRSAQSARMGWMEDSSGWQETKVDSCCARFVRKEQSLFSNVGRGKKEEEGWEYCVGNPT